MSKKRINWNDKKEELIQLLTVDKLPYKDIAKIYDCTPSTITNVAKRLGIDISDRPRAQRKSDRKFLTSDVCICMNCGEEFIRKHNAIGKFCSHKCSAEYKAKEYLRRWKEGKETGLSGEYGLSKVIRNYLLEKSGYKCSVCGWGETNPYTGKIPLEIDHIDGDYKNNREDNLRVLCPNCHSLTPTYKGANYNNGRKSRNK